MKRHHKIVIGTTAVLIFVVSQLFLVYLIYDFSGQSLEAINRTEQSLNDKISLNKIEVQSQISILVDKVDELSSEQVSLKDEISKVKATASADFSDVFENSVKGVVTVLTDVGQGSGFVVTSDGFVVTNYHVVDGASAAAVKTYDGESHSVGLVGYNVNLDVAVLKINGDFDYLELGDSDDVKIGEKVAAIGNPLGLDFTLTEGIVSALDREGINGLPYYLQIDAALNPGNSGGPLLNTAGEVIGINNFKVADAESVGFALEINKAKDVINEITLKSFEKEIV